MSGTAASAAFAAAEAIEAGEWDAHLGQVSAALRRRRLALSDPRQPPPKTAEMEASGHQVWVWMNGPGKGHWEIRGTGAHL